MVSLCGLVSIACPLILVFVQVVSHRVYGHIVVCIFVYKMLIALGSSLHLRAESFQVDGVCFVLLQFCGSVPAVCPLAMKTRPGHNTASVFARFKTLKTHY